MRPTVIKNTGNFLGNGYNYQILRKNNQVIEIEELVKLKESEDKVEFKEAKNDFNFV